MALMLKSAAPVWVVSVLCAIAIAVWVAPADYLTFLPVALGVGVILTLFVQLGVGRADGYIVRSAVTLVGVLVVLGVTTAALAPAAIASV